MVGHCYSGCKQIIVAAAGSQELVRIDRIALHERLAKAKQGEMVTPSMKAWGNIPNDAGFLYGIRDFIPTQGKGPRSVVATGGKIYTANYYTSELVSRVERQERAEQVWVLRWLSLK